MSKLSICGKALAATAIAFGAVSTAFALPQFTIDPTSVGGGGSAVTGDNLQGAVESFLQITSATTVAGHGFMRFVGLNLGSNTVYNFGAPNQATAPGFNDVIFWAEYVYTTQLTGGTIGAAGSTYNITSLTFDFYGERNDAGTGSDSVFTDANSSNSLSATVARSGDAVQLGSGTLISGVAAFNLGGGSSFTPTMSMSLINPEGEAFFVDPSPFYPFAFTSATNTAQAFGSSEVGASAQISGSGNVDFNAVPEPGSLALLGLGLVGLAASRKRKSGK